MTKKKNKNPFKIKPKDLLAAGYTYKMSVLTPEEKDWLENGRPNPTIKNAKDPAPDFFYYFKQVGEAEVQIFSVGNGAELYYKQVRLKTKEQLPMVEKLASDGAKWDRMLGSIEDTPAVTVASIESKEPEAEGNITLKGGPLDGKRVKYLTSFPFYMVKIDGMGAPRYKRSKEDKTIYEYDKTF